MGSVFVAAIRRARLRDLFPYVAASAAASLVLLAGVSAAFLSVQGDAELVLAALLLSAVGPLLAWEAVLASCSGRLGARSRIEVIAADFPVEDLTVAEARAVLSSDFRLPLGLASFSARIERDATRIERDACGLVRRVAPGGVVRSVRAVRFFESIAPEALAFLASRVADYVKRHGWDRTSVFSFGSSDARLGSLIERSSGADCPLVKFFFDFSIAGGFVGAFYVGEREIYGEGFELVERAYALGAVRRSFLLGVLTVATTSGNYAYGDLSMVSALVDAVSSLSEPQTETAAALLGSWAGSPSVLCDVARTL